MADLQKKMETHQQDIDHAKEQIHDTAQKADSYLTELTKRVEEYDKEHPNVESAGAYLKSALDASRSATQKLKTQGQDLSERSVPVAIDGMKAVRESLDDLQKQAVTYDNKYTGSRGQQAVDTLHHWVNTGRQRATDAMETTNEQLMKLRDTIGNVAGQAQAGAQVAVGEAVRAAEFSDEKLGVTDKAGGVVQKVRELDARLGVTATAAKVDTKITGGLGCKVASTTVDMVTESVNYISETLHNAKLAAQHSDTAQSIEAKGATMTGAAAAKKNEVQSSFNEVYEKGKEKAGMATEKTEEKADEAKEMAKGKASEAVDMTKDKTEMAKEKTAETAGQAKDEAQDTAGKAANKTGEMKDKTQQKAGETKEQSKGVVGQAVEKAGDVKEKTKEQLESAADTAKEMGARAEATTVKPKEPTKSQEETTTEKGWEAAKQTGAKASEAAKTASGTAKKHGKHGTTGGEREMPGFKEAQKHASKNAK